MKELSHDRLLSDCFLWCWNTYPQTRYCMFHVRNESPPERVKQIIIEFLKFAGLWSDKIDIFCNYWRKKHIIQLTQDKAIGILPGVLDLIWYHDRLYCFDIKVGKDRLSDNQKSFIAAIEAQDGQCYEIRSLEQFKNIIIKIIDTGTRANSPNLADNDIGNDNV